MQNKIVVGIVVALVVGVGGGYALGAQKNHDSAMKAESASMQLEKLKKSDDAAMKKETDAAAMKKADEDAAMKKEAAAATTGDAMAKDETTAATGQ